MKKEGGERPLSEAKAPEWPLTFTHNRAAFFYFASHAESLAGVCKPLDTFLPLKYSSLIEDFLGKEKFINMPRTRLLPKERKKEIRKAA